MFDLSLVELAVIGLVALLVLGPQRLPRAARTVGLYVRKARASWYAVKADIERELAADELKRSLKAGEEAAKKTGESIRRDVDAARRAAADTAKSVRSEVRGATSESTSTPLSTTAAAPADDASAPRKDAAP